MGQRQNKLATFGISVEDKNIVSGTWFEIKRELPLTGHQISVNYFEDYPEELSYFKMDIRSVGNLKTNPVVSLHGVRLMKQLAQYVTYINNSDMLTQYINYNAQYHKSMEISSRSYKKLRDSIVKTLTLKYNFSPLQVRAWRNFLSVIFQLIINYNKGNFSNRLHVTPYMFVNRKPKAVKKFSFDLGDDEDVDEVAEPIPEPKPDKLDDIRVNIPEEKELSIFKY